MIWVLFWISWFIVGGLAIGTIILAMEGEFKVVDIVWTVLWSWTGYMSAILILVAIVWEWVEENIELQKFFNTVLLSNEMLEKFFTKEKEE